MKILKIFNRLFNKKESDEYIDLSKIKQLKEFRI